jgi:hypothetical protein
VSFPGNASEQDEALLAVPTEDQEEALINMAAGYPQKMRFMYNFDAPMVT